jgi:uncharacterized membrane protein YfcA
MSHPLTYFLLFLAALIAGAINSVAGGGTLLTFPMLLAVLGPAHSVAANATSTVALVPGSMSAFWGYRAEMQGCGKRDLLWLGVPSLLGGLAGAFLLLHTPDKAFARLVPWLILGATTLFMLQGVVRRRLGQGQQSDSEETQDPIVRRGLMGVIVFQFFIAVYGGFFGAGIGILMLAALGFVGFNNIHRMNGLKNFAAVCINAVASLTFIIGHKVNWPLALLMMAAAIAGGYGGAGVAQRLGQANVRRLVVGLTIGIVMLYQQIRTL